MLDVLRSNSTLVISWGTLEFRENHTTLGQKWNFTNFAVFSFDSCKIRCSDCHGNTSLSMRLLKMGAVEALLYVGAKINFCQSLPRVFSELVKFYVRNEHVINQECNKSYHAFCHYRTQSVFPWHSLSFPDTVCLSRTDSVFPGHSLSFPDVFSLSRTQSVFPGHILPFPDTFSLSPDTLSLQDKKCTFVVPLAKLSGLLAIHLAQTKNNNNRDLATISLYYCGLCM